MHEMSTYQTSYENLLYYIFSNLLFFHVQSNVQLGLDFLSPESLGQAARLAEEIRSLPNDHAAKLQILEVREILSLLGVLSLVLFLSSFPHSLSIMVLVYSNC